MGHGWTQIRDKEKGRRGDREKHFEFGFMFSLSPCLVVYYYFYLCPSVPHLWQKFFPRGPMTSNPIDYASGKSTSEPSTPTWMKRVPLVTGILAALAGYLTVRQANLSNEAIYHSNQGVLHQARASDKWTQYQADSIKRHMDETALLIGISDPASKAKMEDQIKELREVRQPAEKADAEAAEKTRDDELEGGHARLRQKGLLDYSGMSIQLGIALASVAALTKKYPAFAVAVVLGIFGIAITAYALALVPHFSLRMNG